MAIQPQFGYNPNTINIKSAAPLKAERQIANTKSVFEQTETVGDWLEVAAGGAKEYTRITQSVQASQDSASIVEAKRAYLDATVTAEFGALTSEGKLDVYNRLLEGGSEQGGAYELAMKGYLATSFSKEYARAAKSRGESALSLAPVLYQAYKEEEIWKDNGDGEGKGTTKTREEWGATIETFAVDYASQYPVLADKKPQIAMAVAAQFLQESIVDVRDARDRAELDVVLGNIVEQKAFFNTPMFLNSKNEDMSRKAQSLTNQIDRVVKAKEKEFSTTAVNAIEQLSQTSNPNPLNRYPYPASLDIFTEAYGGKALQKYQDYTVNYEKYEEARQLSFGFVPTETTNWTQFDKLGKEVSQGLVDERLVGLLNMGQLPQAHETILKQGAVDGKRLNTLRKVISSGLGNKESIDGTVSQLLALRFKHPGSFNVLYPDVKKRGQILAIGALSQTLGKTTHEAWLYMKSNPQLPMDKLTKNEMGEMFKIYTDVDIPAPLRSDVQAMFSTLSTYGLEYGDIKDIIDDYIDSDPYTTNFKNSHGTELGKRMNDQVENFKEFNGGGISYIDHVTGIIKIENADGTSIQMIDEQGLSDYVVKLNVIKEYNRDHWIAEAGEEVADDLSTWFGKVVGTEGQSLKDMGTFLKYFFDTKIRTDGSVVKRGGVMNKLNLQTQTTDKSGVAPYATTDYIGPNLREDIKNKTIDFSVKGID